MNKLVLILAAVVIFSACDKEKSDGRLDPNAMISLRAAKAPKAAAETRNPEHRTPLEIVEQARQIIFINKEDSPNSDEISRGFSDNQRDFVNERLLMWGTDIIEMDGSWHDNFIGGGQIWCWCAINQPMSNIHMYIAIPSHISRTRRFGRQRLPLERRMTGGITQQYTNSSTKHLHLFQSQDRSGRR